MLTISLKCSNCGANLEIKPEVSDLACGYCGASLVVEREGGTVYLRQMADGISAVRVGTDKTATELSIQRLERESDVNEQRYAILQSEAGRRRQSSGTFAAVAVIVGCVIALCKFGDKLATYSSGGLLLVFGAIFGIPILIYYVHSINIDHDLDDAAQPLRVEYNRIQAEIVEKRAIADT